eukprot:CAMPEP_0115758210 /NCGR_PEP_ID=MMETSP0272-20121206/98824_1 /TAXON_ID=71861 /ORGANISM="Scrippsiella trochoidea, Strain CCMP3099" /LENGTH=205 /DNA_ID=CAMNT_0003203753 /DNA_START=546 /DNA_END=1163 /DNA_ORIENTATION=-
MTSRKLPDPLSAMQILKPRNRRASISETAPSPRYVCTKVLEAHRSTIRHESSTLSCHVRRTDKSDTSGGTAKVSIAEDGENSPTPACVIARAVQRYVVDGVRLPTATMKEAMRLSDNDCSFSNFRANCAANSAASSRETLFLIWTPSRTLLHPVHLCQGQAAQMLCQLQSKRACGKPGGVPAELGPPAKCTTGYSWGTIDLHLLQ